MKITRRQLRETIRERLSEADWSDKPSYQHEYGKGTQLFERMKAAVKTWKQIDKASPDNQTRLWAFMRGTDGNADVKAAREMIEELRGQGPEGEKQINLGTANLSVTRDHETTQFCYGDDPDSCKKSDIGIAWLIFNKVNHGADPGDIPDDMWGWDGWTGEHR